MKVIDSKNLIRPLIDKEIEDLKGYDQTVSLWQERWSEETDNQNKNTY